MDPLASAAFASWSPQPAVLGLLVVTGLIYWRGWQRGRFLLHAERDGQRLACFLGGLSVLALALESPLDALDGLFLSAHMLQHLLLLMLAPPLLLLGQPFLPLLRGLPKGLVRDGFGPFLSYPPLRRVGDWLTAMPTAWLLFALSTLVWHLPRLYELALASPFWHGLQHACFFWSGLLFWWPIIQQTPRKKGWPQWAAIPYLLFGDIVNTALSAFLIFSGQVLYPTYGRSHAPGFSAQDDQALAGAIMWVPGSLIYLLPAILFAMRLLNPAQATRSESIVRLKRTPQADLNWTRRTPALRRFAQAAMAALAIFVIVQGLYGSQAAPVNAAGVLPWIYWRGLSVIALLAIGNLFCMVCPFVFVRDIVRSLVPRRLRQHLRWPHALRNKWLAVALTLVYLWAYEAFALWSSPSLTAWIIVGYFAGAALVDSFFRGASFCKYVCPIGQFHFVTSLVSPREVRVRQASVCNSCRTHDCIKGNASARGCELDLFQPKKASNLDCTFCLDCVKACPHDNVALLPVLPAGTLLSDSYRSSLGRLSERTDYAALALLITFGAFVNAAGMIGPVTMAEHRWHAHLGAHGMPIAVGLFTLLGAVAIPAVLIGLCAGLNWLFDQNAGMLRRTRRFVFSLVPMGVAMWGAHLLYHLGTALWQGGVPTWLTPAQILLLDFGVLLTLYLTWQLSRELSPKPGRGLLLWAPWSALAISLYVCGVWILLQPMEMRGMMHSS